MSTGEQDAASIQELSLANTAAPTGVGTLDGRIQSGADRLSNFTRQAAKQFSRTTDYLDRQRRKLKMQAAQAGEIAEQHPIYVLAAVGLIGFGVGMLVHRSRASRAATP